MFKTLRYRFLNLKSSIKGTYLKLRYGERINSSDNAVLIDLPQNKFNRYLYPIIYMLNEQGYKPILRLNAAGIAHLARDPYQKLIIDNGLLFLSSSKLNLVKSVALNPDYFNALKSENRKSILPMSMHPLIYANNINVPEKDKNINKVIFFAGTTSGLGHKKPQVFKGVISRFQVIDKVKSFDNVFLPKDQEDYATFKPSLKNTTFLIFERHIYNLSQSQLLNEMNRYTFFLALPGRGMPLCHNLVEAMYCGNIPILQDLYAEMMPYPLVDNVNCLIYNNLNDLDDLTHRINALDVDAIKRLTENVKLYYADYLSPKAVSKSLIDNDIKTFYLQAEGFSIGLYKT